MKLFVFALALIAVSSANQVIHRRMTNLIQEGYSVDNVVNLLVSLVRVNGDNLQTLINNWSETEAVVLSNIGTLEELLEAQQQRCNEIDATISGLIDEVKTYKKYIKSAKNSIKENLETLAERLDRRCSSNYNFVQKLKDNQDTSKLLAFLRQRITDPGFKDYLEANKESLVELSHSVKNNKRSTLSLLAKHHMLSMMQQYTGDDVLSFDTEARTAEQIGHGHQDNDRGEISLDSYQGVTKDLDEFISDLVGYIDNLIKQLEVERNILQENEFKAVEDLIDYQTSVEHINTVLNNYIDVWTTHIDELEATLEVNKLEDSECHERAGHLSEEIEDAQADFDEREAAYLATRKSLEGTLAALQEVIELYVKKVVNAPSVYLKKIDEELAKAQPVEPEPVAPLTTEEKADLVDQFEEEKRAEEAREAEIDAEEREAKREEAAAERIEAAIEQEAAAREQEKYEEAQDAVETVVQEESESELAREEAEAGREAADLGIESEDSELTESYHFPSSVASEVTEEASTVTADIIEESKESFDWEEESVWIAEETRGTSEDIVSGEESN